MEDNQNSLFGGATQAPAGYRLQALEVYNWGTFHHKTWQILPQAENALLTGDIGSGKSTLVDAITTLLVPHHKIVFNAAAGAQNKERTIRSYILGEYKNVRAGGYGLNAKSVSLREANATYTVLIARFENQSLDERVSLAQVFWIEDSKDRKFFIVAKGDLSFHTHFSNFGSDVMQLKSRLRKSAGIEVFDSFKDYNQRFRQYFGMSNDKTLQLFYQTVSMKSVDNLTLFVRHHMLEEPDAREQLNHLLQNFKNLQQAHKAVMKARKQMNLLEPVVKEGKAYEQASEKLRMFEQARMALPMYVAEKKLAVLSEALEQTKEALLRSEGELQRTDKDILYIQQQIDEIRNDYLELGGNRINVLKNNIQSLEQEKLRRRNLADRYKGTASQLNLAPPESIQQFEQNKIQGQERSQELVEEKQQLTNEQIDLNITQRKQTETLEAEKTELDSLKNRKNQIPEQLIRLRAEMSDVLGLDESDIPFAGELLQVKEDESDWEGAIERVLHGFGLSLLVSEANYHAVSQYIDRTNLRGRIVYFRTTRSGNRSYEVVPDNSLIHKVEIKPETVFEDWLENHLEERYNYLCVESLEEFRRSPYALTRQGQIKQGRSRHEKDDRRKINDRRHFVLGWTNEKKIRAVERVISELQTEIDQLAQSIDNLEKQQSDLERLLNKINELMHFQSFEEIDWKEQAHRIEDIKQEIAQLESTSDQLAVLMGQIEAAETQLKTLKDSRDEIIGQKGKLKERVGSYERDIEDSKKILDGIKPEEKEQHFPALAKLDKATFSLASANTFQSDLLKTIDRKIELRSAEQIASRKKMIGHMSHFTRTFPEDTVELQPSAEYLDEMRRMHQTLKKDDLPKFEEKFKELLQKGTINDIALFKNKLEATALEITEKIGLINTSLKEIEYNTGTYIELIAEEESDYEIREFRSDLKNCLSHALGKESYYSEEKYLQVKKLLDRFSDDAERRWRDKVIDVRNWYSFGASEKNLETQLEVNYYSDSSGKSGGQKEKLAYTVLASALAYQYGVHDEQKARRSFRFVVIDEAFGRGSDESTRFGLELFKRMGLQLLVVTPMQKINVISPYIAFVHFVSNPTGQNSEVLTLTRDEYLQQQADYWGISEIAE